MKTEQVKSEDAPIYAVRGDDAIISRALEILAQRNAKGVTLGSTNDTKDYLRLKLAELEHEVFGVVLLDNRHRVLSFHELFRGTLNGTAVYPREVLKLALGENAAAVILFHNHPSGVPEPSRADELLTARLKDALNMVDIRTLDHLVIGADGVVSFSERGLL